jgi:hypothetical protein
MEGHRTANGGIAPAGFAASRCASWRRARLRRAACAAVLAAALTLGTAAGAAALPLAPEAAIPGTGGQSGASIALSADGSTALVGSPSQGGNGRVAVYVRSGGAWVQQGPALAGSTARGLCPHEEAETEVEPCHFGFAVALSADGSTALVGAPRSSGGWGTAYVYQRSGTTWALSSILQPFEAESEPGFGRAVALSADGEEALIGGPGERRSTGAAWVFEREGPEWQPVSKLTAGDGGEEGERFASSVALSPDGAAALIGAPGAGGQQGAAWPFTRSAGGWSAEGQLEPQELLGGQQFGHSVALSGDGATALVGAPGALGNAGDAGVFVDSGGAWTAQGPPLGSVEGVMGSRLGTSVALGGAAGNIALLGAPGYESRDGEIWEYGRIGTSWTELGGSGLGEASPHGRFGSSVALAANAGTALVGAPFFDAEAGGVWSLAEPFTESSLTEPPAGGRETGSGGETGSSTPKARSGLAVLGTISESPPVPTQDRTGNISPSGGTVLVKLPGSGEFVHLTGLLDVPFGTVVDATDGSATVTTVGPTGKLQTITFSSGIFKLVSRRHGKVAAVLSGGNFALCSTGRHHGHRASAASARRHTVRKLWASGHGSYTTQGKYAAGAVQGTKWLTEDRCDGTLIVVLTDEVLVTNLVNHHKKLVKAHHSYFAAAP